MTPATSTTTVGHTSVLDAMNGAQDILPPTVLLPKRPRKHGREVENGKR